MNNSLFPDDIGSSTLTAAFSSGNKDPFGAPFAVLRYMGKIGPKLVLGARPFRRRRSGIIHPFSKTHKKVQV